MQIQPLQDKIVIERLKEEEEKRGGIIIPDTAKEKPLRGRVVSVGKGKVLADGRRREPAVAAGNQILFSKYAGNEIKVEGQEYLILSEDEILAIIE